MARTLEGRFEEAAALLDPVLADGRNPGDAAFFTGAWLNWFAGRWALGVRDCEAIAALHPTAPSAHSAWVLSVGAALCEAAGEPGRSRAYAGEADRVYADRDFYWFSATHRWGAGHLARFRGDVDGAADRFVRAAAWLRRCGLSALESQILADVVDALVDASRPDEASAWADRAQALAAELDTPFASAIADHAAGSVARDAEALRRAADGWTELGAPFLRARALERVDELGALSDAAVIYAALPAPALAERVRAELRRHGSVGKRAAQRVGELTPREHEVLALAATGLTTRAIAGRLHVSERTVESHLSRIYAKLGIGGRGDLPPDGPA
jgi:DNA-binding CsgD family transcriptional regulator